MTDWNFLTNKIIWYCNRFKNIKINLVEPQKWFSLSNEIFSLWLWATVTKLLFCINFRLVFLSKNSKRLLYVNVDVTRFWVNMHSPLHVYTVQDNNLSALRKTYAAEYFTKTTCLNIITASKLGFIHSFLVLANQIDQRVNPQVMQAPLLAGKEHLLL